MSKCIQPQCKCAGYREPQRPKNTLLQFKLNCQECGHQASEHRKLTPVDHYIKSEVAAGKRSKCTFLISPSEIPTSLVFSPLDLIMIPSDDDIRPSNVKENSVQCTCKGFKVPDVIRLCQAYRTHSMEDVASKLKDSLCSFCNHPLSSHSSGPRGPDAPAGSIAPMISLKKGPALGPHHGLSVKASSSIAFSPVNSKCLDLMTDSDGKLALVVLEKRSSTNLLELKLLERKAIQTASASSKSEGDVSVSMAEDRATARGEATVPDKLPPSVAKKRNDQPLAEATAVKRSRRSSRLATKKARKEELQLRRKLKGLKGAKRLYEEDEEVEEEGEESGGEDSWTEEEASRVGESTAAFIGATDKQDLYIGFQVPLKLTSVKTSSLLMSTLQVCVLGDGANEENRLCFPVTLGSKKLSRLYLTVMSTTVRDGVLQWKDIDCGDSGTVDCVVMKSQPGIRAGEDMVLLAGMSNGTVHVWNVELEGGSITDTPVLVTVVDFSSRVVVASLTISSSDKLLAVGTESGDVSFSYLKDSCTKTENGVGKTAQDSLFSAVKSVHCSCAPVTCMAWAANGQILAVGGCDDAIQILQSVQPQKPLVRGPPSRSSILTYFKKTESFRRPNLIHTHSLKGHNSFIASLTFSRGHYLTSLGWDGQLLFWRHLTRRKKLVNVSLSKCRPCHSEVEIAEPVGGYKIGPSPSAEFLPSLIRPLAAGCGFLVAMENKLGGITVACYTRS